jgi:hypothetical protein
MNGCGEVVGAASHADSIKHPERKNIPIREPSKFLTSEIKNKQGI